MPRHAPEPAPESPLEAAGPDPHTVEELRYRFRRTREECGLTVTALAEKTRARAHARARTVEVVGRTPHARTPPLAQDRAERE